MSKKKVQTKKKKTGTSKVKKNQVDMIKKLQAENAALVEAVNTASEAAAQSTPPASVPNMPALPPLNKPETMKDKPSVTDVQPAVTKEEFQRVISAYKKQNPEKYEMKKVALGKKLATLPSERKTK